MSTISRTDLHHLIDQLPEAVLPEVARFLEFVRFKHFSLDIKVTAKEAKLQASLWLHQNVSYLIATDPPTLVVGERVIWRVPAWIGFPHVGRVGVVGTIEVDVETGEMGDLAEKKLEIRQRLETLRTRVPPYKPPTVNSEYLTKNVPVTPKSDSSEMESVEPVRPQDKDQG